MNYEWMLWNLTPESGIAAIDVGANKGQWTLRLADRFLHVKSFEPLPDYPNVPLPGNVKLFHVALWSSEGELEMRTYDGVERTTAVMKYDALDLDITNTFTAPCRTLDSYDFRNVDFIKVDTEGAETHVLAGAMETLRRERPRIIIEVHRSENGLACMERLKYLDYRILRLDPEHPPGNLVGERYHLVGFPDAG